MNFNFRDKNDPTAPEILVHASNRVSAWLTVRELFPDKNLSCVGRDPMWDDRSAHTTSSPS